MMRTVRPLLFVTVLLALYLGGCTFSEYSAHYSDDRAIYAYEYRPYHPGPAYVYQQPRPIYIGDGSRHHRDSIDPTGLHLGSGKHDRYTYQHGLAHGVEGLAHGVQVGSPMRHGD